VAGGAVGGGSHFGASVVGAAVVVGRAVVVGAMVVVGRAVVVDNSAAIDTACFAGLAFAIATTMSRNNAAPIPRPMNNLVRLFGAVFASRFAASFVSPAGGGMLPNGGGGLPDMSSNVFSLFRPG